MHTCVSIDIHTINELCAFLYGVYNIYRLLLRVEKTIVLHLISFLKRYKLL